MAWFAGIDMAWAGSDASSGSVPDQPTMILANDETGTSFTATIAGLADTDKRALRYHRVEDDDWTTYPEYGSESAGNGTVQVTGLEAGGYEVEAFGRAGTAYGPTSVRGFIWVDAGTAAANPIEARAEAALERLLSGVRAETGTLRSRNGSGASFDPTAATAVTESYDEHGDLACTGPRAVNQQILDEAGGRYRNSDWYVYVRKSQLDAVACIPKAGDQFIRVETNETYEVIGTALVYDRAGYRLILRRMT